MQSRLVWEAMAFKIMVGTTHPGYSTDIEVSSCGTEKFKHRRWLHASTIAVRECRPRSFVVTLEWSLLYHASSTLSLECYPRIRM